MVREAIRDIPQNIKAIYALPDWNAGATLPADLQTILQEVSGSELERISQQKVPNQAVAELKLEFKAPDPEKVKTGLSLYLERVQDPGNLGTILRIADWFGIAAIFLSPDTVEPFNPKVIQSSMGSVWRVPVETATYDAIQTKFPQIHWVGSSLSGSPLKNWQKKAGSMLVIGNEGKGMSPELSARCEELIFISGDPNSKAESLNAAVSTAILVSAFSNF
ncbi:MAG: RNA methyltransferase [Bacteroidetes bacterium]|nr:RNA methyltransferase [Bacteroidota bacterium]